MSNSVRTLAAAALLAAGIASLASSASAMPISDMSAVKSTAPANVETVQWRGRGGWRGGRGWGGPGAGFIAGAIIAGALAAPYYAPGPYYGPPRAYYGPPGGDVVAYCLQRFKSYDPGSGTYLGFDGYRHPCP